MKLVCRIECLPWFLCLTREGIRQICQSKMKGENNVKVLLILFCLSKFGIITIQDWTVTEFVHRSLFLNPLPCLSPRERQRHAAGGARRLIPHEKKIFQQLATNNNKKVSSDISGLKQSSRDKNIHAKNIGESLSSRRRLTPGRAKGAGQGGN